MKLSDVSDIDIPVTASAVADGWWIGIYTGLPSVDHLLGRTSDNSNEYEDWDAYAESWVRVSISSVDSAVEIPAGYRVDVTSTGGTKHIKLPAVSLGEGEATYYYAGLDGSTYVDRWLCQTAYDAALETPTPSPSVTPTPSITPTPQPCEGRDWMKAAAVTSLTINSPRSSVLTGWKYNLRRGDQTSYAFHVPEPPAWVPSVTDNNSLITVIDKQNVASITGSYSTSYPLVVYYDYIGTTINVTDGDYLTAKIGLNYKKLYLPSGSFTHDTAFFYDSQGAAYYDQFLCDLAAAVPTPTAAPSPSPSPSPYVGLCLQWTLDPFTEEQTSLWDELNTMRNDLLRVLNGGLVGDCFSPDFAIGWGQIGANAVDHDNLRDYIISNFELQTGANDSRTTLDDSLGSWDLQSSIQFNDVFNINHSMSFTKYTDTTHAFSVVCRNTSLQEQSDNAYNLKIYAINDDGETNTALVVDRDNGWIGLNVQSEPAARLDVKGSSRFRGLATFDQAIATNWVDFTTGDTSPSVALGMNFRTTNSTAAGTAPVIINRFDNGVSGQRIFVLCQDNRTAFSNTTTGALWLNGRIWTTDGVNWVPHTDGPYWTVDTDYMVEFVNENGKWREHYTSRYGYHWNDQTTTPSTGWDGAVETFDLNSWSAGDGLWVGSWEPSDNAALRSSPTADGSAYSCRIKTSDKWIGRGLDASAAPDAISVYFKVYPSTAGNLELLKRLDGSNWTLMTTIPSLTKETWTSVERRISVGADDFAKISNYGIGFRNPTSNYMYIDSITISE